MINKTELIKLLGIAMVEKSRIEGKIELLGNQLRMITQKESQMIAEAERLKSKKVPKKEVKKITKKPETIKIKP